MAHHQRLDITQFPPRKATASFQSDRIEPELRFIVIPCDVNMLRFAAVAGLKEEAMGPTRRIVGMLQSYSFGAVSQLLKPKGG